MLASTAPTNWNSVSPNQPPPRRSSACGCDPPRPAHVACRTASVPPSSPGQVPRQVPAADAGHDAGPARGRARSACAARFTRTARPLTPQLVRADRDEEIEAGHQEIASDVEAASIIRDVDNVRAPQPLQRCPLRSPHSTAASQVNLHFAAFVSHAGMLFELDGRKEFAINHGPTTGETFLAVRACLGAPRPPRVIIAHISPTCAHML
jgi:hypothetical protein